MSAHFTKEEILDFVCGEIADADKKQEIEEHIKSCAQCAAVEKEYRAVTDAANTLSVDFSEDIWKMQRDSIIRRLRKTESVFDKIRVFAAGLFEIKKIGVAFLLVLFIGAGATVYKHNKTLARDKAITEKMEFFENMEIIERLEFYEKVAEEVIDS